MDWSSRENHVNWIMVKNKCFTVKANDKCLIKMCNHVKDILVCCKATFPVGSSRTSQFFSFKLVHWDRCSSKVDQIFHVEQAMMCWSRGLKPAKLVYTNHRYVYCSCPKPGIVVIGKFLSFRVFFLFTI